MLPLLPLLLSLATSAPLPQEESGTVLHEPKSGVTLTLPEGWEFVRGQEGLIAVSPDEHGFILLAAAEENFEKLRGDVKALILQRLDEVVVARTTIQGVDERGALEELVGASGTGIFLDAMAKQRPLCSPPRRVAR